MYDFSHTDFDDCSIDNGGCEQNCTNEIPTFSCSCREGYSLDSNKLNCTGMLDCYCSTVVDLCSV